MQKSFLLIPIVLVFFSCTEEPDLNNSESHEMLFDEFIENFHKATNEEIYSGDHENYIIGSIEDVKYFNEHIYLIDQSGTKVLIISKSGDLIQQVTRSGRGPGEYENPTSIGVFNNELILLDQRLSRITRYISDDETIEFKPEHSGSYELNMTDLCLSNGEVFVHSSSEDYMIHKINSTFDSVVQSFGEGYEPNDLIQREIFRNGKLTCDDQFVYSGFVADNTLRIYNTEDGSLLIKIEFNEIKPVEISVINRDGVQAISRQFYQGEAYDERGGYHDHLQNLVVIDNQLLVQYERSFSDSESDQQYIVSLMIDPRSGDYSISKELPLLFDYSNQLLITGGNSPTPNIEMRKLY